MKKTYLQMTLITVTLLGLASCSSGPRTSAERPLETVEDYVPRERYPNPAPEWQLNADKYRDEHGRNGDKLYFGEGDLGDDREIACDHARQVAEQKMAKELNSLLEGNFQTAKTSGRDGEDATDVIKDSKKSKTADSKFISQIQGLREVGTYWEKRDYSKSGGKKTVYFCTAMMEVGKRDFELAVKRLNENSPRPASQ